MIATPTGTLKEDRLGAATTSVAASASPRQDMCKTPQQTAAMNMSHWPCSLVHLTLTENLDQGRKKVSA